MAKVLSEQAAEDVKRLAEKAAPHRIRITDELGKKLRFLRQSFVLHFVKDINKKKDREEYVQTKIQYEKIFRQVKDLMHYEGGADNPKYETNRVDKLIESVELAVQWLRYVGHTENLDRALASRGMTITTRSLATVIPILQDPDVKENIVNVMNSANHLQTEICAEANAIKIDIYNELDDVVRYDSKTNKSGIKSEDFNKLTTLEAKRQKAEDSAEKELEKIKDSVGNTIDSKLNVQTVAQVIVQ